MQRVRVAVDQRETCLVHATISIFTTSGTSAFTCAGTCTSVTHNDYSWLYLMIFEEQLNEDMQPMRCSYCNMFQKRLCTGVVYNETAMFSRTFEKQL